MAPMMAPVAAPLGGVVLHHCNGPMRVLDIAAGHGLFGIEVAKQNSQAHVTGLDWAPVLRVALENAVSVASVLLLTEATMTEIPEKEKALPAEPPEM